MKKKVTIAFVIIGILAISTMIIFSTYKSSEAYRKAKEKDTVGVFCGLCGKVNA